jgi:integrase
VPKNSVASIYLITPERGDGARYTEQGFKANWNKLQIAWEKAGGERFHFHDLRAAGISRLKQQGRLASELSGHRAEKTADTVYDRRRVRRAPAVE